MSCRTIDDNLLIRGVSSNY